MSTVATLERPGSGSATAIDKKSIQKGLIKAGIPKSQIEISELACVGYGMDVGPISMIPKAIVGVRRHADVERAVKFAHENGIAITPRGGGSGLPGQSVGGGIVLDMRSLTDMEVLGDHPDGGKIVFSQAGVICTRMNNYLKDFGVFIAPYPASQDMATIGGMVANNSSGANSCKLGTTMNHVEDLHVVLSDGTGLWTSEIDPKSEPWSKIAALIKENGEVIEKNYPKVPKNSSGYNAFDINHQIEKNVPIDWSLIFAHSEGTLGVVTEAKLRAVPLPTQKATAIVYFTDLQKACGAIPEIYDIAPSCFDMAVTNNLYIIRDTYPHLNIPKEAKIMYIIEFDDLEVKADPTDPAGRIGSVTIMEEATAAKLIESQMDKLKKLLESKYADSILGFDIATDPAKQDAFWLGRRSALQVLYAYDTKKKPLPMIECVVIPREEEKLLSFISYMEEVFEEQQVVAGTHGHAGDCNFHIYLLLNLSEQEDRKKLIQVITKITRKVTELGGTMSGEHADGRTRGLILPFVFSKELFDVFVGIKNTMDPANTLHPGVKIIPEARDQEIEVSIEQMVGIEAKQSQLNLDRFADMSHLYTGVCSVCSQCADSCSIFKYLSDEFAGRTEAAPTFKRALAMATDAGFDAQKLKGDPLFDKIYDMCLLCGSCTFKCATDASMRDMVIRIRAENPSKFIAPVVYSLMKKPRLYNGLIRVIGATQGLWQNKLSRRLISWIPSVLLPTRLPYKRVLPRVSKKSLKARHPELVNIPPAKADAAYFYGCSSDLFAEPIAESFLNIAKHNGWKISLPDQRCCGEPFGAAGNVEEYHRLAKYNIDKLSDFKCIVAHCPSCILAFKEYAKDFEEIGEKEYAQKAREIVEKLKEPAQYIMEVVGKDKLKKPSNEIAKKVTIHLSCHEKLGQQITSTSNYTREFLNMIPGVEIVEMKGADECCGLGGPWGLASHYNFSVKMRQEKIKNIIDTNADVTTSWCHGCMMQMSDGLAAADSSIETEHPLDMLSQAYGEFQK
jgi:FAD/FMN-containing dehydrogenase/Fe-S oxidoreductase